MAFNKPTEEESSTAADASDPRVRLMCSFGGRILPRPHDRQLRYVGGDTRIVAVNRRVTNFSTLLNKLSKLTNSTNIGIKYQLPSEDLDSLITVTTDEDVENMMDEYDRLVNGTGSKTARLRIFLFQTDDDSRNSSIRSLLDGSVRRESWFFDALNGGSMSLGLAGLERGRSEASSIVSEVPDYLFGLDNSEEPKGKTRAGMVDNVSASDPGSPAPVLSTPYCSVSDLPISRVNPTHVVEIQNEGNRPQIAQPDSMGNYYPVTQYSGPAPNIMPPVYYVPGPITPRNLIAQHVPTQPQYVDVQLFTGQQQPGHIQAGLHQSIPGVGQVHGGVMRPVARMVADELNQHAYYGVNGGGMLLNYPG